MEVDESVFQAMASAIDQAVRITGSEKVIIGGEGATITDFCLRTLQKKCPDLTVSRSMLGEKANSMAAAEIALDKWIYLTSMLEKMKNWL
jgi:predicted NBD/HSP70 family sugar kinase